MAKTEKRRKREIELYHNIKKLKENEDRIDTYNFIFEVIRNNISTTEMNHINIDLINKLKEFPEIITPLSRASQVASDP